MVFAALKNSEIVLQPRNVIKNNGANPMMEVCTIDCYPSQDL